MPEQNLRHTRYYKTTSNGYERRADQPADWLGERQAVVPGLFVPLRVA